MKCMLCYDKAFWFLQECNDYPLSDYQVVDHSSLLLNILQHTLTGAHRSVTHDVPVTVVPERLWTDYQEPTMPDIDVSISVSTFYAAFRWGLNKKTFSRDPHRLFTCAFWYVQCITDSEP